MNWIAEEFEKRDLTEASKDSVHKYEVRVALDGTNMSTVVFAENVGRARKIANKLFGAKNVKSQPVKK